jgi:lipopolysaccharide/colanic/teichoic acid biosynthesis glycosyltransferase
LDQSPQRRIALHAEVCEEQVSARKPALNAHFSLHLVQKQPSPWSQSGAKRLFDFISVLMVLPLMAPVFLVVALAVRLTSSGPVLFLQKRTGCHGRTFTILKFRTMTHSEDAAHNAVTTTENQRFTPVGPLLRRWKLDELPQLLNVLVGDMSLVGARPKLPEHQVANLECRPGITGAATVAFAHEAVVLAQVPKHHLDDYYREVILPTKHQMDVEYMAHATFLSDLKLLVNTLLCRWDRSACDSLLDHKAFGARVSRVSVPVAFSIDV